MIDAAQAVVDDEAMSRDGYSWFRSSTSQADAHRDGLTVDGQGLAAPVRAVAKLVPRLTSRSVADATWVKQTRNVHTRTAAAYGVVLVDDPYDRAQQLAGVDRAKVCPLLFGIEPGNVTGPLSQFQATRFEKSEVGEHLMRAINTELGEAGLHSDVFLDVFNVWWPGLETAIEAARSRRPEADSTREPRDMLEEILALTRNLSQSLDGGLRFAPVQAPSIDEPMLDELIEAWRELVVVTASSGSERLLTATLKMRRLLGLLLKTVANPRFAR